MVYADNIGQAILFGGTGSSGELNDTWTYSPTANTWSYMNPTNSPPARARHTMVYASNTGQVILFGGVGDVYLGNTWTYSPTANTWTDMNPINPPPARYESAMVYAGNTGQVILFGGDNPYGGILDDDTWTYSPTANTWTDMNPINHPSGRRGHAMIHDKNTGQVVMFGGSRDGTWTYSPTANTWTDMNPINPPRIGWNTP